MLVREVVKTLLVILLVLLLLILANTLVKLLDEVAGGEISLRLMGAFFVARMIKLTGFLAPPAFFFAILWVLGRMYRDSEMVALQAAGVGTVRLYRPFVIVALLLSLLVAAFSFHFYPAAKGHAERLARQEKAALGIGLLKPGGFSEFGNGRFMVYVGEGSEDGEELRDLFVRYERQGSQWLVLAAEASIEPLHEGRFLVLRDGYRYGGEPGSEGFFMGHFQRYGIRLPDVKLPAQGRDVDTLPFSLLYLSDDRRLKTELQWRLAIPLSVFALMLVSVPLSRSLPRQGVYGRLFVAVVFYVLYLNLLSLAKQWMKDGQLPEWMGIWWVPASATLLGGLLLYLDSIAVNTFWRRLWSRK